MLMARFSKPSRHGLYEMSQCPGGLPLSFRQRPGKQVVLLLGFALETVKSQPPGGPESPTPGLFGVSVPTDASVL